MRSYKLILQSQNIKKDKVAPIFGQAGLRLDDVCKAINNCSLMYMKGQIIKVIVFVDNNRNFSVKVFPGPLKNFIKFLKLNGTFNLRNFYKILILKKNSVIISLKDVKIFLGSLSNF